MKSEDDSALIGADPGTRPHGIAPVVLGAAIVATTYGMARFALGLSAPRIVEDHVASESELGYASSLSYITYVAACFISSHWLNRGKWRFSVLAASFFVVVGCSLVAAATSPTMFIVGVGLAGAAAGFTSGAVAYRLVRTLPQQFEPRGQAIANAGTGFGVAVATVVLLLTGSWRAVYILAAVLAPVFCIWFCLSRDPHSSSERGNTDPEETRGKWSALAIPVILTILMGAGSSVYWTYGRSVAESQAGLSENQSLLFWGLIGVAAIGGSFSGDLVKRFGTSWSWSACSITLAAATAVLPFSSSSAVSMMSGVVFGLVYTAMCGLTIELGRQSWRSAMGSATSILFATIAVGQALGSLLVGALVGTFGLTALFAAGSVIVAIGAPLVWAKRANPART